MTTTELSTEAFDACFRAQPFFPAPTREGTLRMIRRARKPGGILIEQEHVRNAQTDLGRVVASRRAGDEAGTEGGQA